MSACSRHDRLSRVPDPLVERYQGRTFGKSRLRTESANLRQRLQKTRRATAEPANVLETWLLVRARLLE